MTEQFISTLWDLHSTESEDMVFEHIQGFAVEHGSDVCLNTLKSLNFFEVCLENNYVDCLYYCWTLCRTRNLDWIPIKDVIGCNLLAVYEDTGRCRLEKKFALLKLICNKYKNDCSRIPYYLDGICDLEHNWVDSKFEKLIYEFEEEFLA